MFRRFVRRPSHATAVAYLGLFVALGGTGAYAVDKLDGADIGKRSIPGNRLEKGSVGTKEAKNLLAEDFKAGQLPAGPQGAVGPRVPRALRRAQREETSPGVTRTR